MLYYISHEKTHASFLCGCSKMVLYIWNQGFECTFCDNNGDNEMPISFALKLWSKWQLNKGIFNKLVFIF